MIYNDVLSRSCKSCKNGKFVKLTSWKSYIQYISNKTFAFLLEVWPHVELGCDTCGRLGWALSPALGMVLSHQSLIRLIKKPDHLSDKIYTNVYTFIIQSNRRKMFIWCIAAAQSGNSLYKGYSINGLGLAYMMSGLLHLNWWCLDSPVQFHREDHQLCDWPSSIWLIISCDCQKSDILLLVYQRNYHYVV